ncbi:DUF6272 family protein [Microseira sp. BLCC-F43]|uniref:DUF6272 family protein n=1 Tax=Microseira sp. BLCC-F43 TaxID=3153602 RepID=UPI0035B83D11
MNMVQIFGDFIDNLPICEDYLDIGFSAGSHTIKKRWKTNRLSAHFVADYLAVFLPVNDEDPGKERRKEQCKGAVAYIANELLENSMKFHIPTGKSPMRFGIHFMEDPELKIILFASNAIAPEGKDKYQTFIQELIASDPQELYILKLERSAEDEENQTSGLGLLTMINDYGAKIGWKFEAMSDRPDAIAVTTMVQLSL